MSEFLSHSECEALLSTAEATPACSRASLPPDTKHETRVDWKPHDFHDPVPLSANAVELLIAIQAGLCQRLERRFQSSLGVAICFRPVGLDVIRFDVSEAGDLSLACQSSSSSEPLPWRITWQPELAHTLIDHLLGGDRAKPSSSTDEPLSEIESLLLIRLSNVFLEVFDNLDSIRSLDHQRTTTIERQPRIVPVELAGDSYLRVSFELACDVRLGLVQCWLPSASFAASQSRETHPTGSRSSIGFDVEGASYRDQLARAHKVVMAVDLARLKLRAIDVAELAIGDVLMTDVAQFDEATLWLGSRKLFRCAIGALDGKKTVRLSTTANSSVD